MDKHQACALGILIGGAIGIGGMYIQHNHNIKLMDELAEETIIAAEALVNTMKDIHAGKYDDSATPEEALEKAQVDFDFRRIVGRYTDRKRG